MVTKEKLDDNKLEVSGGMTEHGGHHGTMKCEYCGKEWEVPYDPRSSEPPFSFGVCEKCKNSSSLERGLRKIKHDIAKLLNED